MKTMDNLCIRLAASRGQWTELSITTQNSGYTLEEILGIAAEVYEDDSYEIHLPQELQPKSVAVYLNGDLVESYLSGERILFPEPEICRGLLGFVQFSFHVYAEEDIWYYSEYASVMVRANEKNKIADAMIRYVYDNQKDFLFDTKILFASGQGEGTAEAEVASDFSSALSYLEEVAGIYEAGYGYFKANCRTRLESVEIVDRSDKLQYVHSGTIHYMVTHPEHLRHEASGIRVGRQSYLPVKTLMKQNTFSQDIYENQVVISFLEQMYEETEALSERITHYQKLLESGGEDDSGYIRSSNILYEHAIRTISTFSDRVNQLLTKMSFLVSAYHKIMPVRHIELSRPQPSAIFLSVPQYNRIYISILKWFGKTSYAESRERMMLNLHNVSLIYEVYVMLKLIRLIEEMGFSLIETENVRYPKQGLWQYEHKNYNNTYRFENEEGLRLTLFCEPLIYDEERQDVNRISLYRNNTVALNRESEEERHGRYYVPDYIIKAEQDGEERYIICDAKYSTKNTVRYHKIPDLAYKYLTSISATHSRARVAGLAVFYGITDGERDENFYDREMEEHPIFPFIRLTPLSEGVSERQQADNGRRLLRELVR